MPDEVTDKLRFEVIISSDAFFSFDFLYQPNAVSDCWDRRGSVIFIYFLNNGCLAIVRFGDRVVSHSLRLNSQR